MKRARNGLVILNVILLISTILIRTQYMLNAFYVAMTPVVISTIIIWKQREFELRINKKYLAFSFILSITFILMLSFEQAIKMILQMNNELNHLIFKVLFLPIVFLDSFVCIYCLLYKSFDIQVKNKVSYTDNTDGFKSFFIYKPVWIIVATAVFFYLAYFPGDPCSDVPVSIIESGHVFSDWHTLGWEFFMRGCVYFTKNWSCLVIAQAFLLIFAHNYVVGFIYKRFRSELVCYVYAFLNVTIGIMQFRYMVNMTKDINFLFTMMFFAVAVMSIADKEERTAKDFAVLAVSGLFASLYRHFSLEIVIVTLVILLGALILNRKNHDSKKQVGIILSVIISIIIVHTFLIDILGFGLLKAEKNPDYVKFSIPMNVVSAMAYRNQVSGEHIPDEIIAEMEEIMPIEKWSDCYCSYDADVVSRRWNKVGDDILKLNDVKMQKRIIRLNWYFLTHNTKSYVISFFDINSIVWEIATPIDEEVYYVVSEDRTDVMHLHKGEPFYAIEDFVEYISRRPILSALMLRGGMAVFVLLLSFSILILKKSRLAIGVIPIGLYAMSLLISIPQANSRYSMPIIVFAILFSVISILEYSRVKAIDSKGEVF